MNVVYINTQDKKVAKDMLIKMAIKLGFHYVEMENEVIIEYDYLFRFVEKEEIYLFNPDFIGILDDSLKFSDFKCDDAEPIYFDKKFDFLKLNKNDYKMESRKIKSKVKTKINYNRRRYQ